ncbi:MAG TPA: hypothetical protein VGP55_12565 [Chitinophagaceae bacterium]|nr:hypothetical protein [Chitinophagaceae bacterium]
MECSGHLIKETGSYYGKQNYHRRPSTPAVYEVDGRQYIVIACGGGKMGTRSGDSYIAFALLGK